MWVISSWFEYHDAGCCFTVHVVRNTFITAQNNQKCSHPTPQSSHLFIDKWCHFLRFMIYVSNFYLNVVLQMYRWPLISSRCKQRPDRDVAVVGATGQRLLESYYWTRWRLGAARFLLSALICSQQLALRRNEVATNFGSYFVLSKRIEFLAEAGPLFRVFEAEAGRSSDAVTNQDSETIGPPSRTKFDEKKFDCWEAEMEAALFQRPFLRLYRWREFWFRELLSLPGATYEVNGRPLTDNNRNNASGLSSGSYQTIVFVVVGVLASGLCGFRGFQLHYGHWTRLWWFPRFHWLVNRRPWQLLLCCTPADCRGAFIFRFFGPLFAPGLSVSSAGSSLDSVRGTQWEGCPWRRPPAPPISQRVKDDDLKSFQRTTKAPVQDVQS